MSITVTLTPANRTGICNVPLAALATESVTFTGADLADGVIVTVMQPDGTPVASGSVASGAVELDLNTKEAHRATSCVAVGESVKAFLVIGDTDALRFTVPIKLVRNYLDNVIPPTATVPVYPTQAELDAILAEIDRIQGLAADQLEEAGRLDASMQETVTNFNAAVTAADTMLQRVVTEGVEEIGGAVTAGKTEIDGAKNAAVEAVGNAQAAAVQAVQNKATEVSGVLDGKVTAAQNAATAAGGHAAAAAGSASAASKSASAAAESATAASKSAEATVAAQEVVKGIKTELQASVDDITLAMRRSVFDATAVSAETVVLNPNVGYYTKALTESAYTFAFDSTAFVVGEGEIAKINLLLEIGDITPTVAFPANVYFGDRPPVFHPNTKTLIELISDNQGAFWVGRMVWTTSNYAYEVEYLTQSETQYIDTGLKPKDDFVYRLKAQCTSSASETRGLFGRYYASGGRACQFNLALYADARIQAAWDGATGRSRGTTFDDLVALNDYVFDASGLTVNGTKVWEPTSVAPINDGDLTMWLGGVSGGYSNLKLFPGNIYNFSVEKNGEKVMDLIPVVDWDGVACWHDKVSGANFYNNGTGVFTPGERV